MNELALSIAINCLLGVILWAVLRWHRTGELEPLAGAEDALEKFARQFPETVGIPAVADDRCSALFDLQRGQVGLLQRQGRRWNARLLSAGDISSVRVTEDGTLHLKFSDFAWPRARVRIADPDTRAVWLRRLNPSDHEQSRLGLRDA